MSEHRTAGGYFIAEVSRTFIILGPERGAAEHVERPAFVIHYDQLGTFHPTGIERVAASTKPLHVAAARRSAQAQLRNLNAYLARHGRRWEVVEKEARDAKRAAEREAREALRRTREAAPAMLAALQRFLAVFPDPIIQRGERLNLSQVATLNLLIEEANAALATTTKEA